jgi:Lysine methyltransferase
VHLQLDMSSRRTVEKMSRLTSSTTNQSEGMDGDHDDGRCHPSNVHVNDIEEDDEYCPHLVETVKTKTGLDIGYKVRWPIAKGWRPTPGPTVPPEEECFTLELSTCLPQECIAPMFDGTQWAGTCIWRSALIASQYILFMQEAHNKNDSMLLNCNKTFLELGCGLGVPGMVLHSLTGCRAILTDKSDLLSQLRRNLETNFEPNIAPIAAHALDWSMEGVQALLEEANVTYIDVILNCDCIYEPLYGDSWRALLAVQNELLHRFPRACVLTACERRRGDGVESYLQATQDYEHIASVERLTVPFDHPPVIELYRLHGLSPTAS